jgi:peptide deformylase
MVRPKTVLMRGIDIDGNEIELEADELEARMYQHELDHLHGVLMFDRMTADQRKEALADYRRIKNEAMTGSSSEPRKRRLRLK